MPNKHVRDKHYLTWTSGAHIVHMPNGNKKQQRHTTTKTTTCHVLTVPPTSPKKNTAVQATDAESLLGPGAHGRWSHLHVNSAIQSLIGLPGFHFKHHVAPICFVAPSQVCLYAGDWMGASCKRSSLEHLVILSCWAMLPASQVTQAPQSLVGGNPSEKYESQLG